VYIGIQDPDPTVAGKGVRYLEEHGVRVHMFDRSLQKKIEQENQSFLEQAKTRSIQVLQQGSKIVLEDPFPRVPLTALSRAALTLFLDKAGIGLSPDSPEFITYLTEIGILGTDKNSGTLSPTGYGLMLFGEKPQEFCKQSTLISIMRPSGTLEQVTRFEQPLVLVPDLFENWLKLALNETSGYQSKDNDYQDSDFPIGLIKEAVINALVHRDYSLDNANVVVEIDYKTIAVKSPGAPLAAILHDSNAFNLWGAPTIRRNPIIAYVFGLMGIGNETFLQSELLTKLSKKLGLPVPAYTMEKEYLTLTFHRKSQPDYALIRQ
jgi:ATP-dependent DNA helicase RecG